MNEATLNIIIKATDKASGIASNVSDAMAKSAKSIEAAGKKSEAIGKSFTAGLTLPILGAGAAAIKLSTDFNAGMANVATLIPGNTARVGELKKGIQDLAIATGKSTTDMSGGMYQVLSAFGDNADTMKILEINAKSAASGLAETTDAINLTSAVTKGYGDTTSVAVQKASDLALMTVRLGQTTFPELASSIGLVTPLAASLNVTQEELFGTMATFTGVTGGASEVATQLRGVMQALMAPTDSMTKLMNKLGYENGAAMVKGEGLQKTLKLITDEAANSKQPLQGYLGSIEGQTLALAAAGGQSTTYAEKIAAMGDVAGTTDEAFKEITSGVNSAGFTMAQATTKVQVLAQRVGDMLAPYIARAADWIGKLTDKFAALNPQQQKTILIVAGLVAAIGPALIIIGKMAQGVAALVSVVGGVSKAIGVVIPLIKALGIAMATNPVLALVAAVALLVVGLGIFGGGSDRATSATDRLKLATDKAKISSDALKEAEKQVTDARLAREGSDIAVQRAEERLTELKDSGTASALDLREAEYNLAVAKDTAAAAAVAEKKAVDEAAKAKADDTKNQQAVVDANNAIATSAWNGASAYGSFAEQMRVANTEMSKGNMAGSVNASIGLPVNWKPGMPMRASGGPVSAGTAYAVGDNPDGSFNKTTELFVPNTSGRIVNSSDLQKALSSNGASGPKSTTNNITVVLSRDYTSKQFFKDLDNDSILSSRGLTTNRGNA